MARWYKLEKMRTPLKWKRGCIENVMHVWPHRPPSEEEFARYLNQRFLFFFGDDLMRLVAKRARLAQSPEEQNPTKRKRTRKADRKPPPQEG